MQLSPHNLNFLNIVRKIFRSPLIAKQLFFYSSDFLFLNAIFNLSSLNVKERWAKAKLNKNSWGLNKCHHYSKKKQRFFPWTLAGAKKSQHPLTVQDRFNRYIPMLRWEIKLFRNINMRIVTRSKKLKIREFKMKQKSWPKII